MTDESRQQYIRDFKTTYPEETQFINRVIERVGNDANELYFKLKALDDHKKNMSGKSVKTVKSTLPSEKTLIVSCKANEEIVILSCYFSTTTDSSSWRVNTDEIKIEINDEGIYVSKGNALQRVVYTFKINYQSIQKEMTPRVFEMTSLISNILR